MKIFKFCFYFICLIGCIIQVFNVLIVYLKYPTVTQVKLEFRDKLELPQLSVCARFLDLFDYDRYNQEHQENQLIDFVKTNYKHSLIRSLMMNITVDDIYDYTPGVDNIFKECITRS